jgi:hypothetical protein
MFLRRYILHRRQLVFRCGERILQWLARCVGILAVSNESEVLELREVSFNSFHRFVRAHTRNASISFPLPSKLMGGATNQADGIMGSCSLFWKPRMEYRSRGSPSFFSRRHVGHGAFGRCPSGWNGGAVGSKFSKHRRIGLRLTTAVQMATTEDVTTTREIQMRDDTILGVDAVRKAPDSLILILVHVGERVAADRAGVDEVERRGCLAWWHCHRS